METDINTQLEQPSQLELEDAGARLLTGAEVVAESLLLHGIDCVFGYPGGAVLPLYDALHSYRERINHVLVRHEQGAVHMAEGYARASGKVGVAVATSGPGASNLLTGLLDAHLDSVPLVVLAGQVPCNVIGKDAFQECDMIGMTGTITKHNFQVLDVSVLERVLAQAFYIARTGRPGPVYVELPKDIQTANVVYSGRAFEGEALDLPFYVCRHPVEEDKVEEAVALIRSAKRPALLVGQGAVHGGAMGAVSEFAKVFDIPVTTTIMAKGIIDESAPLAMGTVGMYGRRVANRSVFESDVLIALGCRFSDRVTGEPKSFAEGKKIIHIDIDPYEIGKNVPAYVGFHCDVRDAVVAMQRRLEGFQPTWASWTRDLVARSSVCDDCVAHRKTNRLHPVQVVRAVAGRVQDDDIVTTGVGQHQMAATHFIERKTTRTFITSGGAGTMGFGLPAGIGAAMASPESTVWVLDGDGSLQMTGQELGTLAAAGCNVVVVVFDNGYLGMVRQLQEHFCESRYHGVSLPGSPDFVMLAKAYGIEAFLADSEERLEEALDKAVNTQGPALIHVALDPESNVVPMFAIGGSIGDSVNDCAAGNNNGCSHEGGGR